MNYKPGDTVICISARLNPGERWKPDVVPIRCGEFYVVNHVCGTCTSLVERPMPNSSLGKCPKCGDKGAYWHFEPWRFVKLDPQVTDLIDEFAAPEVQEFFARALLRSVTF